MYVHIKRFCYREDNSLRDKIGWKYCCWLTLIYILEGNVTKCLGAIFFGGNPLVGVFRDAICTPPVFTIDTIDSLSACLYISSIEAW